MPESIDRLILNIACGGQINITRVSESTEKIRQ